MYTSLFLPTVVHGGRLCRPSIFGKKFRNFSIALAGLLPICLCAQLPGNLVVSIATNTGESGPYTISWDAAIGQQYDVLATDDLNREWAKINSEPLATTNDRLEFTDFDSQTQRFYQVILRQIEEPMDDPVVVVDLVYGTVTPARAAAKGGQQLQLSAAFSSAGAARWSLFSTSPNETGRITDTGLYHAPGTITEPSLLLIHAQNREHPNENATALVTLLPDSEFAISREQAIQVLMSEVIDPLETKKSVIALGLEEPLDTDDLLVAFDPIPDNRTTVSVSHPCWFFMVDHDPTSLWIHPVDYVLINCETGAIDRNIRRTWFPEVNGLPIWNEYQPNSPSQDLVHVGTEVNEGLDPAVFPDLAETDPAQALVRQQVSQIEKLADEFLPIHRAFPAAPTECECPEPSKSYAFIVNMNPDEGFLVRSVPRLREVFESNRFITKTFTNGKPDGAYLELDKLRPIFRPCDILVIYAMGHGYGGNIGSFSTGAVMNQLELLPGHSKYLILETCDAGHIFDTAERRPHTPPMTILTASNKADPDAWKKIRGTAPLITGEFFFGLSAFTGSFLACLARHDTLEGVVGCLVNVAEIGPMAIKNALAGPRLARVGSPDSDNDGVTDKFEKDLWLDSRNKDTDGDGICDGIEFGQLYQLETPNNGSTGSRSITYAFGLRTSGGSTNRFRMKTTTLPPAIAQTSYESRVQVANGIPINDRPHGRDNPFGLAKNNGFHLTQGSLPPGLALDQSSGIISGIPSDQGTFRFTIRYMDAIGASVSRDLSIVSKSRGEIDPVITVSTGADGNTRDDELTFREAVMLLNGELQLSDLKADPDLDDRVAEGEQRWVAHGLPAADKRDRIEFLSSINEFALSQTIKLKSSGDVIQFWPSDEFTIGEGPVLEVSGNDNLLDNSVGLFKATSGSVVTITGNHNVMGRARDTDQTASMTVEGNSGAPAIIVKGKGNRIYGTIVRGGSAGIMITEKASESIIWRCRLVGNQDGLVITDGAHDNHVFECTSGFLFEAATPPKEEANLRHGIVLSGGAFSNLIEDNGIGGNGGSGILITGTESKSNRLIDNRVGHLQGRFRTEGAIRPNQDHGVKIEAGASENRVSGGEINNNLGHGILITGQGTRANAIGEGDTDGIEIDRDDTTGSAIVIEGGATENSISVEIKRCLLDAIIIRGTGTENNRITNRNISGRIHPCEIENVVGIGILITDGAKRNRVEGARVRDCGIGIEITGASTQYNVLSDVDITGNLGTGIRFVDGCKNNQLRDESIIDGNIGHGILISGAQTTLNEIRDCTFNSFESNALTAIRLESETHHNILNGVEVRKQSDAGILVTSGAHHNQIERCSISGGRSPDDIEQSGSGIMINQGAFKNRILACTLSNNGKFGLLIEGARTEKNYVYKCNILSNREAGIRIENSSRNLVGSPRRGGNDIQRNLGVGLHITGSDASENRILNNEIGATFSTFFTNALHGVLIDQGARANRIGGVRRRHSNPAIPQLLLPPTEEDRGAGNLITGNGGDGIRIDGAHDNLIFGNLIGFSDPFSQVTGNGGFGVALVNGAKNNCVGNCPPRNRHHSGYSNQIVGHTRTGIWISGSETTGNSVRRNEIYDNSGSHVTLDEGGNSQLPAPNVRVNVPASTVEGTAARSGYIELFSNAFEFKGVFHMSARVGAGDFVINQANPANSVNATLIESVRPIRFGEQFVSFTELSSGNTSPYTRIDLTKP